MLVQASGASSQACVVGPSDEEQWPRSVLARPAAPAPTAHAARARRVNPPPVGAPVRCVACAASSAVPVCQPGQPCARVPLTPRARQSRAGAVARARVLQSFLGRAHRIITIAGSARQQAAGNEACRRLHVDTLLRHQRGRRRCKLCVTSQHARTQGIKWLVKAKKGARRREKKQEGCSVQRKSQATLAYRPA